MRPSQLLSVREAIRRNAPSRSISALGEIQGAHQLVAVGIIALPGITVMAALNCAKAQDLDYDPKKAEFLRILTEVVAETQTA